MRKRILNFNCVTVCRLGFWAVFVEIENTELTTLGILEAEMKTWAVDSTTNPTGVATRWS